MKQVISVVVPHLVVVGFDEIVSNKYITCILDAVRNGDIDGYSIIDLKTEEAMITDRLASLELQPEYTFYLPVPRHGQAADISDFKSIFENLIARKGKLKVYIATELRAHEEYLTYCVENNIDSLTEKPVFAPMSQGRFNPEQITQKMKRLVELSRHSNARHSVMSLGRYHDIYNEKVISPLQDFVNDEAAPLTSLHLRAAGGVWNLHREYESRNDHPYKYGYGMLMHGAYHYIDLVTQLLLLNKSLYDGQDLRLAVSSYAAFPHDQNDRISKKYSSVFDDNEPDRASLHDDRSRYGETDTVTSFRLFNIKTGGIITLGTLAFEQTTPSIRAWKEFPQNQYNKNGRTSSVSLEAQFGPLLSVGVNCYDVPRSKNGNVDRIDAFAQITKRANSSLLGNDFPYVSTDTYDGLFHSDSNKMLMRKWLANEEQRSTLEDHLPVMLLLEALALSITQPGHEIVASIF